MSQEAVQMILGRALTDPEFRQRLIDSAADACQGYDLTAEELAALEALDAESLKQFAGTLDDRISRSGGRGFVSG